MIASQPWSVGGGPLWVNQFGNTHGLVQTTTTIRSRVTVYLPRSLSCANYWNKLNKWHSNWGSSLNPYRLWITIILNITNHQNFKRRGYKITCKPMDFFVKNNSTSGIMAIPTPPPSVEVVYSCATQIFLKQKIPLFCADLLEDIHSYLQNLNSVK